MQIKNTPNRTEVAGTEKPTDLGKAGGLKKADKAGHIDTAFQAWKQHRPESGNDASMRSRTEAFSVSSFAEMAKLGQNLPQGGAVLDVFRQLDGILTQIQNLALPPQMDARGAFDVLGAGRQVEQALHQALSGAFGQTPATAQLAESVGEILRLVGSLLSGLQGRAGQPPLGYPQAAFGSGGTAQSVGRTKLTPGPQLKAQVQSAAAGPAPQPAVASSAGRDQRAAEAKKISEGGALGNGGAAKPKLVLSDAEQKLFNAGIAAADDDAAVAMSQNQRAMDAATPEQKAKLIKELMSGHTNDTEDRAIAKILETCTSKAEFDKVMELSGGKKAVMEELDDDGAKGRIGAAEGKWNTQQKAAAARVLVLLEECESPEEAKELAAQLGGPQLKHQIQDPEQLKRLEALATRFNMPALGYGLPPEVVSQKRLLILQAVDKEDSDLATKLAEDRDAMRVASPAEKAQLIRELGEGWTKDRQDVAVYKILSSCTSKAEFDEVMQLSGGKEVLGDMDDEETCKKMNELFGSWGRVDLADDKGRAAQFQDVMADPKKQAALAATRPPNASELNEVGGAGKIDPKDAADPLMQQADQAMGTVKKNLQSKAFDVDWDPQAKTELVLEQRRREVEGRPRLDFTALTAAADKITSDPDFNKKVQAFRAQHNSANPLDKLDEQEAREKFVEANMEGLRKQHGLSEQTMKALVTQRMGQINTEAAVEMNTHSKSIVGPLKLQLAEVEKSKGKDSAEAVELRERIAKFERVTGEYSNHLASVGEIQKKMFPVPSSFWEGFVSAFSVIADIAAAVVSCIPGVGNALGAAYFGVKAIVAAAKGDLLGVFSSIASAIPGVGGAIGGAVGSAVKTAGRAAQTAIGVGSSIAEGNVLGALGSAAGLGSGVAPIFDIAQKGLKMADGISRGDISAIAGAAGGLLGPVSGSPAVQSIVGNPVVQTIAQQTQNALPFIEGIAKGDLGRALGAVANGLGPLAGSPEAKQVLDLVNGGAQFVEAMRSGEYGKAMGGLGSAFERMGASPEAGALTQSFGQVSNLIGALGTGSPSQLAAALRGQDGQRGFLQEIGGGALTKAFAGVSGIAGQMLGSPEFRQALDLTRQGTRFLGVLGNGELGKAMNSAAVGNEQLAATVRALAEMLAPAEPLVQSMAGGDFRRALEALRGNPETSQTADRLALLDPLADLASADWLKSLEATESNLGRLAGLDRQLHRFQDLERSVQQLQQRFRQVDDMAAHLLQRSGFTPPVEAGRLTAAV